MTYICKIANTYYVHRANMSYPRHTYQLIDVIDNTIGSKKAYIFFNFGPFEPLIACVCVTSTGSCL